MLPAAKCLGPSSLLRSPCRLQLLRRLSRGIALHAAALFVFRACAPARGLPALRASPPSLRSPRTPNRILPAPVARSNPPCDRWNPDRGGKARASWPPLAALLSLPPATRNVPSLFSWSRVARE